jgi:phosphotransferase system  glucose/maltose/N-acetylglucosamine-specific IIC component
VVREEKSMLNKILKALLKLVISALCFFVVTFTIYFFNLDMKATSLLEPFLEKWYDHLPRNQYL